MNSNGETLTRLVITRLVGIIDCDWPVATFVGLLFPDNKLVTHGNPDAANHFDLFRFGQIVKM